MSKTDTTKIYNMSRPGIEPGSVQPQCTILTTVRSRPTTIVVLHYKYQFYGSDCLNSTTFKTINYYDNVTTNTSQSNDEPNDTSLLSLRIMSIAFHHRALM